VDARPLTVRTPLRTRCAPLAGLALACALVLATAGCNDEGGAGTEPGATTTTSTPDPAVDAATGTTVVQPVGDPLRRDQLVVGDCFNSYDQIKVTTRVSCDMPHFGEVFHFENHPAPYGEPYPNDRELEKYAERVCYAQFQAFDGGLYEVSRLDIGVVVPAKDQWTDSKARYRGIICYVHDQDGQELVGSMRGRGE
jgi:hypothetical protein